MSYLFEPDQEEIEKAILYLIKHIDEETWEEIRKSIAESGDNWSVDQHFGIGLYVRNLIRKGGIPIDGIYLESRWNELIEEAMKRIK